MEDETNFMEFSVVDECGSDEGDDPDDEIQVLDEIGSSNPSKESDLFADMVVLDISTSPTKELEEVTEKSRNSHRSDRSNRYRDKRSPYRERSSGDKRSSNRESSRKDEEKRSDRRRDRSRSKDSRQDRSRSKDKRQDRSRSKDSRYKSSSDRRRCSREKEQEKSSSSKRSQITPTKEASKRSQSSKQTEKRDIKSSITKSSSKVHSKENQKTVKEKDSKEKLEKATVEKPETDGESEGEGISISTDDNIFSGIHASDMNKSDFVTLTVVDEDDIEETNAKKIPEKKTTSKSSDSYPAKCRKADVTEKTKTQSPIITASDDKRKTQQSQKIMKPVNKPASKNTIQEKEKAPLKITNRLTEIFKPKSDSNKEVEMVVVEDIDKLDKPSPKPRATSTSQQRPAKENPNKFKVTEELFTVENVEGAGTRKVTKEDPNKFKVTEEMFSVENVKDTGKRKPTKEDPNKFKVTEELFTVENMDKANREVKIIGVDDLLLKNAEKEESKDSSNIKETSALKAEESKSVNKAQVVVVEDSAKTINPQKNQGASPPSPVQRKSVREVSSKVNVTEKELAVEAQKKTEQEVSIVNDGNSLEKKEEKAITTVEIKDKESENLKKDDIVKLKDKPLEKEPEKETKLFEVPSIDEEEGKEMEISIMDDLNVESKSSEISGETDEDVIEVIFSNGEEEEEMLLNSKTEFEDNFSKGTDQSDNSFSSKLAQDQESSISSSTNREPQAKGNEQIDENQDSDSHNKDKIPSPQIANNEQNAVQEQEFKEIESPIEPDDVIEDGMEIIVLSDTEDEDSYHEHEMQYKDEENIDHNDNEYADTLADDKDKDESTEIENTGRDAEVDGFIEDGTEITMEDEGSGIEAGDEDNLGEIDEDAFLAMMQSEGLTVEDADDAEDETRGNSEQVDEATDSTQLIITVSQTSEKRDVKSSGDSQEKSELKSPIDRISSNLAKIRKEMDNASKQSKSGSKEGSSHEKDEARSSRERSKDRGSREPSKDKEGQNSKSSEGDLRQVLKNKKSQGSRDLRDVIKERKSKEIDDGEPEQCLSEDSLLEVDEYFEEEELVEIDTFYDDYQEKKLETVVIVDETLLPKEKEHWGFDTVGEVMRLPMKMTNVSVEDLGRESATFMLEACDAFFVDLNSGDGALYIDNSELKTMRPFIMIGKIAKFLKECPHVDVECDRAISFLLEEKLKAVGIKKKNQIPKRGLLYIRGIPKHISEEKLANSLKAIEAIIPKNLMDKRIGFAMVVYNTTEEVKKFLATLKIFDKTCISYQEIAKKRKGLFRELQEHPEAKEALLDGDTQLQVHKRQVEARKRLMAIQEQIMKKNKEKIKKTRNKKLQKQRERQKEKELRSLMMRAKKIMEEEGLEENLEIVTDTFPGKYNKGRSMEEHEQLRSPLKNAELKTATWIVPIEGSVRDADYNRLRREVLDELKDDISNGRFKHQNHLEDAIRKGIEAKRKAEARIRLTRWGSGGVGGVVQTSQPGGTGEVYSINQFKEDFRKTRVMVQGVPMPDSSLPNMVPDSIEIMIPVQEGSLPMQGMQGQTHMMPIGSQVLPAPLQMVPRPDISSSQVPISSIPGVPTLASVQQPFPLSQAPQMTMASVQQPYLQSQAPHMTMTSVQQPYPQSQAPQMTMTSVQQPYPQSQAPQITNTSVNQAFSQPQAPYIQNFQHHPTRPLVSNYVQTTRAPMPVPSTIGQQVPILQGMQQGGVAMQPRGVGGTLQRPPTGLPMPGLSQPGLVGYPGSRLPGAVPPRNIAPRPVSISNPPGTVPRAPVPRAPIPRAPVPVVNPVTPSVIQSQPVLYKPPTSNAPTAGPTNPSKKPVDDAQNRNNSQQEKSNKDDRVSDTHSRSKGRENAPAIKINVGSQFSRKSMQILKRKNEDIDGMPMSEGNSAKKSKTDEVGPKSILKIDEQQGKIDMFETEAGNSKSSGCKTTPSQSSESQFKRKGNLISVPIQQGTVQQQRTTSKPAQQQEVGKKIQVLQNRIAQKFPSAVSKKASEEPPQEDTEQGNVSPQTLSYLRSHQVSQQKTSYSSSESEDDSTDFMQRLKGPEGLMSLMDVDVSGVQPSGQGIQDMLKKWDYLAEKQKLQREKEKLARKEAKLKKFMEKAPILMQEYEENERKRQEKRRAQENDPLIKLLQSALEAAQEKANKRRSPSPVLTDNEEEDMSLSEDEEKTSASGEFIIDYGHRSLTGQKDKPQKLTRRQRRERRMDQKKAEMEYRKKMESEKGQKSTSEKDSRDELTDMLKSSLKAVQDHLDEMKKQKPQSQQEQASQNPFLQDLMSRVHTHIKAQQGGVSTSTAQQGSQPGAASSSGLPQKSFTQTSTVNSMEAGSRGPGTSWASQMQPQHGGPVSITPYVPLSSTVSNLPSNTFEYGHSSKSVQPSWGGGYGGDFRAEVSSAAQDQMGEKPVQERTEVFDYGHKSKSETKGNPPASTKDTATASSTQPQSQTDIHSLTIESISEILQVAKTLQASQAKIKDTIGKPNTTAQQQKVTQENLKRNSVGELLKNISQSGGNSSQSNKGPANKSVSGQASSGPTGTRMHFHGNQGKNQKAPYVGHQGNQNNLQSNNTAPQQNREKSESPPVEMFLEMEGSRYERQKQREEEERRKRMEKNSPVGNFGRQQSRGNNSSSLQGVGRGSALPGGRSSSSSFGSGQRNSNQSAFGSGGSHSQQHSQQQNRQGHNQNRQGQNTMNMSSHNTMNRPGQNTIGGFGQNTMNRPGQNMNRQGQNNMGGRGQNMMNRPGNNAMGGSSQNTMNRPGQNSQISPGQMQSRPGQPQQQRYPGMSQSSMQSKRDAESITELMTENELQSWENLQRQLRQSYLEDQISGPTMSAYDQRLKQSNQQAASSQNQPQAGSLDWFQQSKQLQMQDRLRRQAAPKGILKGAPTKASKIWAEEDMEFHSTSQQVANWGQGAKSFNQGNKGPNSTLVHYANSDSD